MDVKIFEIILQKDIFAEKNILNIHKKLDKKLKILFYQKIKIILKIFLNLNNLI